MAACFALNNTDMGKIEHTLHGARGWILEASEDIPGLPKDLWKPNLFHIVSLMVSCSMCLAVKLLDIVVCVSSAVDHCSLRLTTSCNSRVAELLPQFIFVA